MDSEATPRCFSRQSWQYTPKEWGAAENCCAAGAIDDTVALQSWLNTAQSFINLPNNSHQSTPGNSLITMPLTCPANTTIQGPTNIVGTTTPLYVITAAPNGVTNPFVGSVSGGTHNGAVIKAYDFCRLSGIGIEASNITDAVDVYGQRVAIDSFSSLQDGRPDDLDCPANDANPKGTYGGFKLKDSNAGGAAHINVKINGCPNSRLLGGIFSNAGQTNIDFSSVEGTIADGVVQESQGVGIDLTGASQVSIVGMHIQGNGMGTNAGQGTGAGILINNANTISICGNHLEGNGGDADAPATLPAISMYSSQIYFSGTLDSINLCGNVYEPQVNNNDAALLPLYVYDADPGTIITNLHLHDSPSSQASGQVYSPVAAGVLPQLQVPHVPLGEISGLTLLNDSVSAADTVDIASGEASDSSNSVTIQLASTCADDLSHGGQQGLDAGTFSKQETYFFFVISTASGGHPSCIASANQRPSFVNTTGTGTLPSPYLQTFTGLTYPGVPYLYNISSLSSAAAVEPGQTVQCSCISSGSATVTSSGSVTTYVTNAVNGSSSTITFSGGLPTNIGPSMTISDAGNGSNSATCTAGKLIKGGTIISSITPATNTINLSQVTNSGSTVTNDCLTIAGGYAIGLSSAPSSTGTATATIYNGLYRLVGALYTTTNSTPTFVTFTQDNDTFYLSTPAVDINTNLAVGSNPCQNGVIGTNVTCALSVPCGLVAATCGTTGMKVEAFGRIVGGNVTPSRPMLVSSTDQMGLASLPPSTFPTVPGYSANSTISTAFPFRLYTSTSGQVGVAVAPSGGGGPVFGETDGWVLHR